MSRDVIWRGRRRATVIGRLLALAAVGAAAVGLLLARGHSAQIAVGPAGAGAGTPAPFAVPDFQLTAAPFAGGGHFVLSQNVATPTILYGMAAWCGSCIEQARTLVQLKRKLGDRVNLVVVDIDPNDTEANLRGFAHAAGGPLGFWAIDRDSAITRAYHILYLHTTIVIRDGQERSRTLEDETVDQLRAQVS